MSIVFALAIYFVVWWIGMFAILPFFARPQAEEGDGTVVPGTDESAPARFPLIKFVIINTIFASLLFAALYAVILLDPFEIGKIPDSILPKG